MKRSIRIASCILALSAGSLFKTDAAMPDEFRIKRESVFEFAQEPQVTRAGDTVTIQFATTAFCDVTVAIEHDDGRILRHLACGVLGDNAPPPLQKNSKAQTLVWDGKDDAGVYVDDKDAVTVRVSLGLKPQLERTLLWDPRRRVSRFPSLLAARPEGVYVYNGRGVDHLRLFDHDGNYLRTVYPSPAGRVNAVEGIEMHDFPQLDKPKPLKRNAYRNTLLTAGRNGGHAFSCTSYDGITTRAAHAMAVGSGRLALADERLNWLETGTEDRRHAGRVGGPATAVASDREGRHASGRIVPSEAAFSPDGRRLYLTGYYELRGLPGRRTPAYRPEVRVMDMDAEEESRILIGPKTGGEPLKMPTSIACDSQGRLYVADHVNHKIRVFDAEGQPLTELAVQYPAIVRVHPENGDIYVFSLRQPIVHGARRQIVEPLLHRFGPLEQPELRASVAIPGVAKDQQWWGNYYSGDGITTRADIDFHADPPVVWISPELGAGSYKPDDIARGSNVGGWSQGIRLLTLKDDKLVPKADFSALSKETIPSARRAIMHSQYLYVHPLTGRLFVGDARRVNPRRMTWTEIDPETGRARSRDWPYKNIQDLTFDRDGHAYGRVVGDSGEGNIIVRFDPDSGREIPWDYGEERLSDGKQILGGLPLGGRDNWWNMQNGIAVAPDGHIAAFWLRAPRPFPRDEKRAKRDVHSAERWMPEMYPGRPQAHMVAIWDRHGKIVHRDAIPGVSLISGLGMDVQHNLTVMANLSRNLPGVVRSCTLMKFSPGTGRFITSGRAPVPLSAERRPDRPRDLGGHWVEGAHWLYGGVGWTNSGHIHCMCWHSRFVMDTFGRSFAPEPDIYRVAVLDGAGNLILRVGRYGNVDDGMPLIGNDKADPRSPPGPPNPRSIGGDEVALFQPNYVGVQTDRRLFIADAGNDRIVGVRLGYHAESNVALKNVPDTNAASGK